MLQPLDVQIISGFMAPDYILPAAESYGRGCAVAGAQLAYREARTAIRDYVKMARQARGTPERDLSLALLLRAIGWVPWDYKHPTDLPTEDVEAREMATLSWPSGGNIPGAVELEVGAASHDEVYRAVCIASSQALAYHKLNRCVLQGKVYQRWDQKVMVHLRTRQGLRSTVMTPYDKDTAWVAKHIRRALKSALKIEKHEFQTVGKQLFEAWLRAGFIVSPAGMMISSAPRVPLGWAELVPGNGISLAATVCKVRNGRCWVTLRPDHRAIDGEEAGYFYEYLEKHVPQILGEGNA